MASWLLYQPLSVPCDLWLLKAPGQKTLWFLPLEANAKGCSHVCHSCPRWLQSPCPAHGAVLCPGLPHWWRPPIWICLLSQPPNSALSLGGKEQSCTSLCSTWKLQPPTQCPLMTAPLPHSWGFVHPRLLSVPELCRHVAEVWVSGAVFMRNLLLFKKQNPGKVSPLSSMLKGSRPWTQYPLSRPSREAGAAAPSPKPPSPCPACSCALFM